MSRISPLRGVVDDDGSFGNDGFGFRGRRDRGCRLGHGLPRRLGDNRRGLERSRLHRRLGRRIRLQRLEGRGEGLEAANVGGRASDREQIHGDLPDDLVACGKGVYNIRRAET